MWFCVCVCVCVCVRERESMLHGASFVEIRDSFNAGLNTMKL
jgi:hypothetical protein